MAAKLQSVVVVGGGLAGLAAAAEIAARGVKVTLVEKNAHLGGKMNVLSERGFTFDMGPTIITLPEVLRGIIARTSTLPGAPVGAYIDLRECVPQWRCRYEDGTVIDLLAGVPEMSAALDRQFPGTGAGEGYARFLSFARRMYRLSEKVFFYKDVGSAFDLMRGVPMRDQGLLRDVLAMRIHSTVGATAHGMIAEPHVRQLVEHYLQYVGSSPFLAPAILSLIAAAQSDGGCWYPMGGTRMVARTLERLGRERGVEFVTGAQVARVEQDNGKATGVLLEDGRRFAADAVVSNMDVQRTNARLLGTPAGQAERARIARKYTPACSGVVLYLGLSRRYEHLAHHNFLFSGDSAEEFGDIYRRGIPARDPTLYVAAPSRSDPSQAPEGGEALYVLVHTPYTRPGQDWGGERDAAAMMAAYKPVVMAKLKRFGMEDIERHVVVDRFLHPGMIDSWYQAEGGAIYGLASHGRLHGGFKPRNRSPILKGLYLTGGSANPGPGVPMVLMSGVTAARAVCEDLGVGVPALVEPKSTAAQKTAVGA
jgi:phytoene desaturase